MSWGDIPAWVYDVSRALMQGLHVVDTVTYHHCCRVGDLSRKLASAAGLNEYEQKLAEFGGMFHDIGKMGVDQEIIQKPGKLDPKELDIMKTHSILSENILRPLSAHSFFKELMPGVRNHHERIDGEGYPDKLSGDDIPLLARMILVADTYDAMSQTRSYRKGLPDEIVYAELKRCSGMQFDSQLVQIFLKAHKGWIPGQFEEETQLQIHQQIQSPILRRAS